MKNNLLIEGHDKKLSPLEIGTMADRKRPLEKFYHEKCKWVIREPLSDVLRVDKNGYFRHWTEKYRDSMGNIEKRDKRIPDDLEGSILDDATYRLFLRKYAYNATKCASICNLGYAIEYHPEDKAYDRFWNTYSGTNINMPPKDVVHRVIICSNNSLYDETFKYKMKFVGPDGNFVTLDAERLRVAEHKTTTNDWFRRYYYCGISIVVNGQGNSVAEQPRPNRPDDKLMTGKMCLLWEYNIGNDYAAAKRLVDALRSNYTTGEGITKEECDAIVGIEGTVVVNNVGKIMRKMAAEKTKAEEMNVIDICDTGFTKDAYDEEDLLNRAIENGEKKENDPEGNLCYVIPMKGPGNTTIKCLWNDELHTIKYRKENPTAARRNKWVTAKTFLSESFRITRKDIMEMVRRVVKIIQEQRY